MLTRARLGVWEPGIGLRDLDSVDAAWLMLTLARLTLQAARLGLRVHWQVSDSDSDIRQTSSFTGSASHPEPAVDGGTNRWRGYIYPGRFVCRDSAYHPEQGGRRTSASR